uniref:Uncharacterized protein n=1 Tax=Lotus japonicus TaxID=34305 RepID=I3SYU8_LOTJA|nr:unknown [Lotus japonicus]
MEKNAAITLTNNQLQHDHVELPRHPRRKKNRAMHVIRVALFMMRGGRSRKQSVLPVDDGSKGIWRKLVGSMRPLHIHRSPSQESISHSSPPNTTTTLPPASLSLLKGKSKSCMNSPTEEEPYSPSPPSTRYASAVGLNELVQSSDDDCEKQEVKVIVEDEDDDDDEEYFDGDEQIDDKAWEFIAQFYQQMKLQRLDSTDRRYNERSERSLGV